MRKVLVGLLVVFVALAGCTQSQEYENPTEVNDSSPDSTNSPQNETGNDDNPLVDTFSVGEKASNGEMAVQINSVEYVKNIPVSESYVDSSAEEGRKFALIDLTVFNQQENYTATVSNLLSFAIQDGDGYTYSEGLTSELERGFESGDVLPGGKKRGRVAIDLPEDTSNLTFKYEFSVIGSGTAVFNLPDKETRYSVDYADRPEPEATLEIISVNTEWNEYDSEYVSDSGSINGIEIRLENTGGIAYTPKVGLNITREGSEVYSSTDVTSFFSALESGSTTTKDLSVYQSIEQSGEYQFEVTVRQEGSTDTLASDTISKVID